MGLAEHQFTYLEHPVVHAVFRVIGTFQRQRQTAARRTGTTGAGHKAAVQVQPLLDAKLMLPPSLATGTRPWPGTSSIAWAPDASRRAPSRTTTNTSPALAIPVARLISPPMLILPPLSTWPYTLPRLLTAVTARDATSISAFSPTQIERSWPAAIGCSQACGDTLKPPRLTLPPQAFRLPFRVNWPTLRRLMPWPGSTLITAPWPTVRAVVANWAAVDSLEPAVSVRLAPRRWVNTPWVGFSW